MKRKIQNLLKKRLAERDFDSSPFRQHYHLMADTGWISDPNGLSQLGNTFHIFHQYTPDAESGLSKAWGHYTTRDWIHFEDLGTLMTPDSFSDKDGCYSGSGYVQDGILHLFYTGNSLKRGNFDYIYEGRGHYTNHLSSADGIHFSQKETLLRNEDYPAAMSCHVRDPKVSLVDGHLYMTLGARTRKDRGCALLYEAAPSEPTRFHFVQVIDSLPAAGYMWECPDLFRLDGKLLLLACPQGMESDGIQYENIYQNGWFDLETDASGRLEAGNFQELDHGFDFYAPQTLSDSRGRRILLGWMAVPDAEYGYAEKEEGWIHCLSLPRELQYQNGRIHQFPIAEIQSLRSSETAVNLKASEILSLKNPCFELELDIPSHPFEISLRNDAVLSWDGSIFTLALGPSGKGRTKRHVKCDAIRSLEIFSDISSLEIFINHGEYALSTRLYDEGKFLTLQSSMALTGTLWQMGSIAIDYTKALETIPELESSAE